MVTAVGLVSSRPRRLDGLGKIAAFIRRDVMVLLSYRAAMITDWLNLVAQIALFSLVGRMVDPAAIPTYGGVRPSFVEFVAVGIAIGALTQIGLNRIVDTVRGEQLMGTLESLLMTPTGLGVIQVGSAAYELLYVPVRTAVFLGAVGAVFDTAWGVADFVPVMALLTLFLPTVWGVGVLSGAAVLTFRRGAGAIGLATILFTATSGTYFPVDLLPAWMQQLMVYNPLRMTVDVARTLLAGQAGWGDVLSAAAVLVPLGAALCTVGALAFRLALRRELRRGTLGLY